MVIDYSLSSLDTNDALPINRWKLFPFPLNQASLVVTCFDQ